MIDNDGNLVLKGQLTKIGRRRVLENKFDISKFAVSDDDINYRLVNENLVDPYIAIERSLLFNLNMDSNIGLKSKIYRREEGAPRPSLHDFNVSTNNQSVPSELYEGDAEVISETNFQNERVNPKGFTDEIIFPRTYIGDYTALRYFIPNATVANQIKDIHIVLPFENLPLRRENSPVSFTLHETKHFDIFLNEISQESIRRNWLHAYPARVQREVYGSPVVEVVKESDHPKTVTSLISTSGVNSCTLRYKGNFKYENIGSDNFPTFDDYLDKTRMYRTFITVTCEATGRYQDIALELIITEDKTES